jgi:hypothetical protein
VFELDETLRAPADQSVNLWFEPWAEGVTLSPGMAIELRASAPEEGRLQIVQQEHGIAVYCWLGCTLKVVVGGEVALDFSVPVPELPPHMDMKQFTGFLFGPPPTTNDG